MAADAQVDDDTAETEELPSLDTAVNKVIHRHTLYAAGCGIIPVPFLEIVAAGSVQLRMITKLCEIYGLRFSENSVKASIGTLVAAALPQSTLGYTTYSFVRTVPLIGPLFGLVTMPALSAATTWALGRVFAWHFARGGKVETFDAAAMKERFKEEFEEGKRKVAEFVGGDDKTNGTGAKAKA